MILRIGLPLWVAVLLVLVGAVDARDFYKILGLQRKCKESEIKKAYHKAALKW